MPARQTGFSQFPEHPTWVTQIPNPEVSLSRLSKMWYAAHLLMWETPSGAQHLEVRAAGEGQTTPEMRVVENRHVDSVWVPPIGANEPDPKRVLITDPGIGMKLTMQDIERHDAFSNKQGVHSILQPVSNRANIIGVAHVEPAAVTRTFEVDSVSHELRYTHQGLILAFARLLVAREIHRSVRGW